MNTGNNEKRISDVLQDSTVIMNLVSSIWPTQKNIYVRSSEYPDIYNSTMDPITTVSRHIKLKT